ncbi:MAG: DCC1-like thiol-disulfide oxidoreductase family protein [Deltaproteobacteria bacterium]|nr:DCC1-like thiol-disulfide oxidoreductase family protein [Deltaproteobacteria bacterium]
MAAIVFFDGVCNLCNASVQFILQRDPKAYFRFAPLQSEFARRKLQKFPSAPTDVSSIVLVEGERYYDRSSAALRIARHLGGLWPVLYVAIWIPPFLRNPIYDFIARRRYRWFGKRETCGLPKPEWQDRFLG